MHVLRLKGGTFIAAINYQLTSLKAFFLLFVHPEQPWRSFFHLTGAPSESFAEDLTLYFQYLCTTPITAMIIKFKTIIFYQNCKQFSNIYAPAEKENVR